eukprot:XP_001709468.1 Hypothetical protein GL50803_115760 [Giardia lamblia ATCC 50803]
MTFRASFDVTECYVSIHTFCTFICSITRLTAFRAYYKVVFII